MRFPAYLFDPCPGSLRHLLLSWQLNIKAIPSGCFQVFSADEPQLGKLFLPCAPKWTITCYQVRASGWPGSAAPPLTIHQPPSGWLRYPLPRSGHQSAAQLSFPGGMAEGARHFLSLDVCAAYSVPWIHQGILSLITNPTSSPYSLPPSHCPCIRAIHGPTSDASPPRALDAWSIPQRPGMGAPAPPLPLCNQVSPAALSPRLRRGLDCTWISNIHLALKAWSKSLELLYRSRAIFPISSPFMASSGSDSIWKPHPPTLLFSGMFLQVGSYIRTTPSKHSI